MGFLKNFKIKPADPIFHFFFPFFFSFSPQNSGKSEVTFLRMVNRLMLWLRRFHPYPLETYRSRWSFSEVLEKSNFLWYNFWSHRDIHNSVHRGKRWWPQLFLELLRNKIHTKITFWTSVLKVKASIAYYAYNFFISFLFDKLYFHILNE